MDAREEIRSFLARMEWSERQLSLRAGLPKNAVYRLLRKPASMKLEEWQAIQRIMREKKVEPLPTIVAAGEKIEPSRIRLSPRENLQAALLLFASSEDALAHDPEVELLCKKLLVRTASTPGESGIPPSGAGSTERRKRPST